MHTICPTINQGSQIVAPQNIALTLFRIASSTEPKPRGRDPRLRLFTSVVKLPENSRNPPILTSPVLPATLPSWSQKGTNTFSLERSIVTALTPTSWMGAKKARFLTEMNLEHLTGTLLMFVANKFFLLHNLSKLNGYGTEP